MLYSLKTKGKNICTKEILDWRNEKKETKYDGWVTNPTPQRQIRCILIK